jgi:superfamily II DNA helicase RecQ
MRKEWGDQVVACTATASAAHEEDIATCLSMLQHLSIRMPSKRTNLRLVVVPKGEQRSGSEQALIRVLRESTAKKALVFCGTRRECEVVSGLLEKNDLKSAAYHAGLNNRAERTHTSFRLFHLALLPKKPTVMEWSLRQLNDVFSHVESVAAVWYLFTQSLHT